MVYLGSTLRESYTDLSVRPFFRRLSFEVACPEHIYFPHYPIWLILETLTLDLQTPFKVIAFPLTKGTMWVKYKSIGAKREENMLRTRIFHINLLRPSHLTPLSSIWLILYFNWAIWLLACIDLDPSQCKSHRGSFYNQL